MHPTLCDTFRGRALWTWDMLARGRSVDCQIGEETLTDLNILELKIRHASEVYTRTFSKPEEGLNGADWEFIRVWYRHLSSYARITPVPIPIQKQFLRLSFQDQ